MSKFALAMIAICFLSTELVAAEPAISRSTKWVGSPNQKTANPILVLIHKANKAEVQRVLRHVNDLTSSPASFVVKFYCVDADPNDRMTRLLNESEDLRQAREQMHRFWMNNQPAVLTYERLGGVIKP